MSATPGVDERLAYARVLVELGELYDAEHQLGSLLDEQPSNLDALSLLAKIKHMRGELSQAAAGWAQLYAQAPFLNPTELQLRAMLQLALDPERGAGELVAVGRVQLLRRPAEQLEIEHAFGLFLQRRPEQAMARLADLARRHHGRDRETYKLAVLARAWIAELLGDLAAARQALEALGSERGFETDVDRVTQLARIYERLGGRAELESALHIWRYLEQRNPSIAIVGRVAGLHRRLGHAEVAAQYEARYAEAFRRRMHRPGFDDVVQVAAVRYLPLPRLAELRLAPRPAPPELPRRGHAVAAALGGDLATARRGLDPAVPLDRKYLGDLHVLAGDAAAAACDYAAALVDDPDDLRVIGWLLGERQGAAAEGAALAFRDPALAARTRQVLEAAIEAMPLRASLWRQLGHLLAILGDPRAAAHLERAAALDEARRREQSPIGRVLAAATYHLVGRARGLIHELWAGREVAPGGRGGSLPESQVLGNTSAEMRQAIRNTFESVREYARAKFPHRTEDLAEYTYTYKITKEDEPSYGLSAGLPTAIAFLSVFLQRRVPQDLALSGAVVADAHDVLVVRAVGDTEKKVKAAYHRNLRAIVLPAANRAELEANVLIPGAVRQELVRYARDLDEAMKLVFGPSVFVS